MQGQTLLKPPSQCLIALKVHKSCGTTLVAAADSHLVGKCFREGKKVLNVLRTFYCDSEIKKENLGNFLATADMANLVGEVTVEEAVRTGHVDPNSVMTISGVPYAHIYTIEEEE